MKKNELSVVIPCYRSGGNLRPLYERLMPILDALAVDYEIIFVEDGGGDSTWEEICLLALRDGRIRGIKLARNYGQHNALLCGIRAATGEIIITMDDDLQNPPEEIHKLLAKIREGYDVVYGTPEEENHGFLRNAASRITKIALQSAMGVASASKVSAFRAFKRKLCAAFDAYRSPTVNIEVLLSWATTSFSSVSVRQDKRISGESGYTLRKLMAHAINMMTGFSTLPLRVASMIGLVFACGGGVVLAYVIARYLISGSAVPGFSFLASIVSIFSGVQLFALGIIGEYLSRMHFRMMERPPYAVDVIFEVSKSALAPEIRSE
ncbi:glycosyltransferase family 2 protein [Acidovorax sp. Root219]|uniref:glycosyltransferase family 2 protein n=1 Tax=Acidovorax sp. Root219 TaxID=1736493 RepID=UPI0009EA8BB9|nr:glycosyltransferase family 2 protein [Acidovorax sp. Root219]